VDDDDHEDTTDPPAPPPAAATFDELLAGTGDDVVAVLLPKLGRTVRIRGLSRAEAIKIADTKGTADRERKMITWAMVEPALTYQQVDTWYGQASAGDLQVLTVEISRVSGMEEDADRQVARRFPDEPGD
jgi:hypothetical protein